MPDQHDIFTHRQDGTLIPKGRAKASPGQVLYTDIARSTSVALPVSLTAFSIAFLCGLAAIWLHSFEMGLTAAMFGLVGTIAAAVWAS